MQKNLNSLKTEAARLTNRHNHHMRWELNGAVSAIGTCQKCKRWVQVIVTPAPNQIDIGGPAISENCTAMIRSQRRAQR